MPTTMAQIPRDIVRKNTQATAPAPISGSRHADGLDVGDGQVLVVNDILGLREPGFKPRFVREYANLPPVISEAARRFIDDVRKGDYPNDDESFSGKNT